MKYIRFFMVTFAAAIISSGCNSQSTQQFDHVMKLDLTKYSDKKPEKKLNLLFIHHSCGAALMAEPGEKKGEYCLYSSHPNGGGLRSLLEQNNYAVHEATYGSKIGQDTDICHWNAKFRDDMNIILQTDLQDRLYSDDSVNNIVLFKSCYPANEIISEGKEPGDPDSCEKTLANYKAAYNHLLGYFKNRPDTLFVVLTAPPLAEPVLFTKGKIMNTIKTVLGRPDTVEKIGKRARLFNNWLNDVENGWLKDYELKNVVVFDYYDVLSGHGKSNWSAYPTQGGRDSHPSNEGNQSAAGELILFLNQAVDRMGFTE